MSNLLEESKRIKEQADRILKESGILDILKDYGEIIIGGSYALDLMLRPDLDLFVITQEHDWNKVLKISADIMRSKYFRELAFVNWIDFKDKNIDTLKGYYFQPWVALEDQLWKMDLWLITLGQYRGSELTEHFKSLLDKEKDDSKK